MRSPNHPHPEPLSPDLYPVRACRRTHLSIFLVTICVFSNIHSAFAAGDVKAGRQKALQCQTCHGLDGQSKLPEAPNLAGQVEIYIVKALKDYRSDARKNDLMSVVAPTLKDQDIDDLAAYYAAIPVTVGPPPK